jgi:endonuclease/exonuclease/phosphatase family metal-dependent hydrolase
MQIATYNVWNNNIEVRIEQLIQEINNVNVDIIGLQEIPKNYWTYINENVKYNNYLYCTYKNEEEGLAFLSKHKILGSFSLNESDEFSNSLALNVIIEINGIRFSVTNVHLPWDSVLEKEKQIVAIDKYIHRQKDQADFFILLGDFNCTSDSSVHHYLLGDQSLLGFEAKPYWNNLASVHAFLNNYNIIPTLDFINNPRWKGKNTNYIPDTCDRILIMESYNWDFEFELKDVSVFGKDISPKTGLAASDHYGLYSEVDFKK